MPTWSRHLTIGPAAVAALFLAMAPTAASAQWWEDEDAFAAYETEGLRDYDYYENYGYKPDRGYQVQLDAEDYYGDRDAYQEFGAGEEPYGVDGGYGEDELAIEGEPFGEGAGADFFGEDED